MAATGLSQNQVFYALNHQTTPQRRKRGRNPVLNETQQQQLVQWASLNQQNRRIPWVQIPAILGWDCGVDAITAAFQRQGYGRFLARREQFLLKSKTLFAFNGC